MRIIDDIQLDFNDVLFQPKRSSMNSRAEADVMRDYHFKWYPKTITSCGIMAANMATTGTFEINNVLEKYGAITCLHKHYSKEDIIKYFNEKEHPLTFVSTGLKDSKADLYKMLLQNPHIDKVCVDIANGYIPNLLSFVKELRTNFPSLLIMAGNVVTPDITQDLIMAGADLIKIGIGPGSVCRTRTQTGVGRPQLSTIIDCADAAHGIGGMVCGDGGCVYPGDVAKAYGAGADFVMLGGMLAGAKEAAGELTEVNGKKYKQFYGMSSELAQRKHFGGMKEYRTTEGREKLIPYTGPVENTMKDILGGVRSMMTYIGARKLKDVPKCTTFYKVNRQINTVFENMKNIEKEN